MDSVKETNNSDDGLEGEKMATEELSNEELKRLLERTRQRREMLNQKIGQTPEPLPRKRLLEENTSQNIKIVKEDEESPGKRQCLREDELRMKADTPAISSVKSRMQQIVGQRAESGLTEADKFEKVSSSESESSPQKHSGSRKGRFAMLAQNINSWEDDLSHPSIRKEDEKKQIWQPPKKETENVEKPEVVTKPSSPAKTVTSQTSVSSPTKSFSPQKSALSPAKPFSPKKNVYSPVKMHNKGMAPTPPPPPAVVNSVSNPSPGKHVSSHTLILGQSKNKGMEQQKQPVVEEKRQQDLADRPVSDKLAMWKKVDTPKKDNPTQPSEAPMASKLAVWEKRVSNTPTKTTTATRVNQPLRQVATTPIADKPPLPKPISTPASTEIEAIVDKNTDPASLPVSSRMASWQQRVAMTTPQKEEEPTAYSVTARMSAWEDMSSAQKVGHIKKVDPSKTSPTKSPMRLPTGQSQLLKGKPQTPTKSPLRQLIASQPQLLKGKPLAPNKSFKDSIIEKSGELKSTPLKNNTPVKLQPGASPCGKIGSATKIMQQRLIEQTQHSKTDDFADKLRQERMAELKSIQSRWQNGILKDKPVPNTQVDKEQGNCDTDRREAIKAKARADFEKKLAAMGFDVSDENACYDFNGEQNKMENKSSTHVQGPPKPPHTAKPPSSIYRLISQKKGDQDRPHMKRNDSVKKVQFEEEENDSFDSTDDENLKLHPQGNWSDTTTDDMDTQEETTSQDEGPTSHEEETTTQDEISSHDEMTTTEDEEIFQEVQYRKYHASQQQPKFEDDSDADDVSLSAFVPASVRRRSVLPSPPRQDTHNTNNSATPIHHSQRPQSHPVASVPAKVRNESTHRTHSLAQDSYSSLSSEDSICSSQSSLEDPRQYGGRYSTDGEYDEMNDLLDEAIEEGEHYASDDNKPVAAPRKRKSMAIAIEDNPLVYSVSMYRSKKYSKNAPSPAARIRRNREFEQEPEEEDIQMPTQLPPDVERKSIKERIQELQELVNQEQSVIMQTSNALNQCCHGNSSFAGSAEQVECNRLLLLACQKRQAYLTEVQRLKDTGQLDPPGSGPKGSLTISDIRLPLKKEFVTKIGSATDNTVHYFLILIRNNSQVIATQMLSTHDPMMKGSLDFPNLIKIHGISGSFKFNMEIYSMSVSKEYSDKTKKRKTPKKVKSNFMPVQSPGGPSAVHTTSFTLITSLSISMRCLDKSSFSLERIPYLSPLHGTIYMRLKCLMEQNIEERGFLTMFEDVSGLGAWHRRWCVLAGNKLCYWKYPDDETRKEPMGFIDLKRCITEKVGLIPRDICARPNTLELITVRQPRRGEQDTLVTRTYNTMTTTKHNLSADTKEERIVWCNRINRALANIRTWHSDAMRPIKVGTVRK